VRSAPALALLFIVGCRAPATPTQTVVAYFRTLGRDPIRSADLLSDAFQMRHGLHMGTSAEMRDWERRFRSPGAPVEAREQGDSPRSLHHAEIAWLATQTKPAFRELAAALRAIPLEERIAGDQAVVTVRVLAPRAPSFVQRFVLSRDSAIARWQIDRIDQEEVEAQNLAVAFVAAPSEDLRRRLAAALGVPVD